MRAWWEQVDDPTLYARVMDVCASRERRRRQSSAQPRCGCLSAKRDGERTHLRDHVAGVCQPSEVRRELTCRIV
jgi:hypothetical protein